MSKSRIFLFILITFVVGVAVRSFVAVPLTFLAASIIAAVAAFGVGLISQKRGAWIPALLFLAFCGGIFRYDYAEHQRPDLSGFYGKPFLVQGIVVEEPERTSSLQRFTVKVVSLDEEPIDRPFRALVTLRRYPAYALGDELKIEGLLQEPKSDVEFDYAAYLAQRNIFALMEYPLVERIGTGKGSAFFLSLARIKHSFEANIDAVLPEPHAALLKGLTLGERESLPPGLTEDLRRTGTSHIVALSGYNITLIGRFFTVVLLGLTVPFQLTFWIATSAIILFVLLTGASASVVRAGIMGVLLLVAEKEGRLYQMRNALAFAGAAMIFHNPYVLRFDAGFQLSFLATLGLVYLSPHVDRLCGKLSFQRWKPSLPYKDRDQAKVIFPLRRTLVETLSAQLAVLPLLIYLFGQISVISPITNVLVLLAVPYAMTAGFITGGLGFMAHFLSMVAGWINWILLEYILRVIEFFASVPLAAVRIGGLVLVPLAAIYGWLIWAIWEKSAHT